MHSFDYKRVENSSQATGNFKNSHGLVKPEAVRFLAGGTTLIDLMKLDVETPEVVVDINHLPLKEVKKSDAGLLVGALVKNSELAHHALVTKDYPVLSQAILAGASTQLRNKATTSGNLLQRTRCVYFRDTAMPCNKREPKSGCAAIEGHNRNLAIMGVSDSCIASNPSDMNVAMMALEAQLHITSAHGNRDVAMNDFYLLPGSTPEKEFNLKPGELITGVTIPSIPPGAKSYYLKLRDRASYEFALASAAVVVSVKGGKFERVRIAMGGIGTKPWRMLEAEKALEGQSVNEAVMKAAAEVGLKGAKPSSQNGFKVELAKRCLVHALRKVTA